MLKRITSCDTQTDMLAFIYKISSLMPWLVYAHGSTMYRRRFCIRYLPDLRSPSEAGRLRGGVKNPEGTSYKTFSYLKSSSIFFNASFWPFFFRVNFLFFSHLCPYCNKGIERISPDTRMTMTRCMGPSLLKRSKKKMMKKKNEKLKLRTVPSRLWKAQ
jgi:hypothetical protein